MIQDIKKRILRHHEPDKLLTLSNRGLFSDDLPELIELLNQQKISHLTLYRNNLDEDCVEYLIGLKHIISLDLSFNDICDKDVKELLNKLPKLETLKLNITGVTSKIIVNLKNHPSLTMVELEDTKIKPAVVEELNKFLSINKTVSNHSLSH